MTRDTPLFSSGGRAHTLLTATAGQARCAVICGVPGMGKSLLLREQASIAAGLGRTVHRLQWDVARQPFDCPGILARYPQIEGSTHPVIRRAAGLWVRRALARWWQAHPDPAHLLLIEAPLVGGRFSELARQEGDAAEVCLSAPATVFLVPVPSREVRAAIEAARLRDSAAPPHARDAASAIPQLVDALWQEVVAAARALALPGAAGCHGYSPELYAALHRELLRHRHVQEVPVTEVLTSPPSPNGGAHAGPHAGLELLPAQAEVSALIAQAEAAGPEAAVRACESWYRL
jgi:hypothetical protein